jgi:hypothetical protein
LLTLANVEDGDLVLTPVNGAKRRGRRRWTELRRRWVKSEISLAREIPWNKKNR